MQIVLVKQTDAQIEPETPDSAVLRRFLFEMVDGATQKDKKAWRRFIKAMNVARVNDYFEITIKRQRNTQFHRLTMAVILAVFKAQERFEEIGIFRQWIKVGCGFVDYIPDVTTGELRAIPRSQSFDDCSEDEAREFFDQMCTFMRSADCCATLWKDAPIERSMEGMMRILQKFDPE